MEEPTIVRGHDATPPPGPGDGGGGTGWYVPTPGDEGDAQPPKAKKGKARFAVVGVGLLALAGVGLFVLRGSSGPTGASSPEAAVEQLIEAINKEDPAAAAAIVDPDEVRTLGDLVSTVERRLSGSGVASEAKTTAGFEVELSNVSMRTRELSDDAVEVTITGLDGSWRVKPDDLPEQSRGAVEADRGSFDEKDMIVEGWGYRDRYEIDPHLIVVKRDGGWFVSLTYTGASYLTQSEDLPDGDYDERSPEDLSVAGSPEEAVTLLANNISDLDPEKALEGLAVSEWSVLWVYRDAIDEYIERLENDGDSTDFRFEVDDQNLKVEDLSGGYKKVIIDGAEGRFVGTDGDSYEWDLDGWCLSWEGHDSWGDRISEEECAEGQQREILDDVGISNPFVVVAQERGGWVVSPNATMLQYGKQFAENISDTWIYRFFGVENVAPVDGTLTVGEELDITLNEAGYAIYEVDIDADELVFFHADSSEGVSLFDPDGDQIWRYSSQAYAPEQGGIHKIVVWGDEAEKASVVVGEVPLDTIPGSGGVSGTVDDTTPIKDYSFQVGSSGYWEVSNSGDARSEVIEDRDAEYYETCWSDDPCYLEEGVTYFVRVWVPMYDTGTFDYDISIESAPGASIDGMTSVSGSVYGDSTSYHELRIPAGVTADIEMRSSASGDLDIRCSSDRCYGGASGSNESITMTGPVDDTLEVYSFLARNSDGYDYETFYYTIEISER